MKKITVEFYVDPKDLKDLAESALGVNHVSSEQDLVSIIQWALYDECAQLEGYFHIIESKG